MNHAPLPFPIYVNVKNRLLGLADNGTTRALWHGIHSHPGQVVMCHLMLETGAQWSGMPLHGISDTETFCSADEACPWGAMGERLTVTLMPYLEGLEVACFHLDGVGGRHTGLVVDWVDGFAKVSAEHKPLNLIRLYDGPYTLLENNKCRFFDSHFVKSDADPHKVGYRRNRETYWR